MFNSAKYILFSVILVSCDPSNSDSAPNDSVATNSDRFEELGARFILPRDEFVNSIELAEQGDPQAAFRLYMHLEMGGENYLNLSKPSTDWLQQAADSGSREAQQHLLVHYLGNRTAESCRNAFAYIERYDLWPLIESREIRISDATVRECEQILELANRRID